MESFSLLKYWRNHNTTTTVKPRAAATAPYLSDGEDGPYFDLEFALPNEDHDTEKHEDEQVDCSNEDSSFSSSSSSSLEEEEDDNEEEMNFTLSPSDELFFKGDLVASVEPSCVLTTVSESEELANSNFLLKSAATKFRFLLLKLKKPKADNGVHHEKPEKEDEEEEETDVVHMANKTSKMVDTKPQQSKFLTIKLRVVEANKSLFTTRDNSSKDSSNKVVNVEAVQKYLKMVKPLYVRVSKRYVEKLKFSAGGGGAAAEKGGGGGKEGSGGGNLGGGLKVVRKKFGKSRSAGGGVAAATVAGGSERRDDSLVQVQDGIQGAILHCKKSFNLSRDGEASSILSRSVSDPSHEKSATIPTVAPSPKSSLSDEAKEIIN